MATEIDLRCGHFRDEVRIDGRCVGVFSSFRFDDRFSWAIQIQWAVNIPPTRFESWQDNQRETFARLFAERHRARLLRASEKCGGRYGFPRTRSHHKPYELGMCHFYYWPPTDDQEEQARNAWILSRRGDRFELLFEDNPEPVILRKGQLPPGADSVDFCNWDPGCSLFHGGHWHQSAAVEANKRRSEAAKRKARNPDGSFRHEPT